MTYPQINLTPSVRRLLKRSAEALRAEAHSEAGQSQMPDLVYKEETQAWKDAAALDVLLQAAKPGGVKKQR